MAPTDSKSNDVDVVVALLESIDDDWFPDTLHKCAGESIMAKVSSFEDIVNKQDGAFCSLHRKDHFSLSTHLEEKLPICDIFQEFVNQSHILPTDVTNLIAAFVGAPFGTELRQLRLAQELLPIADVCARKTNETWAVLSKFSLGGCGWSDRSDESYQYRAEVGYRWSDRNVAAYWSKVLRSASPASERFKNNREIVLAAFDKDARCLLYASEQLKNDREIVLAAVNKEPGCLNYASEQLKSDREIVLVAVNKNPCCLYYASEQLKNDKEIVLVAVDKGPECLQYASEQLKNDREFVLAAVDKGPECLQYASVQLKNDREIALVAVNKDPGCLVYASEQLKNDREFVRAINDPARLQFAVEQSMNDK